MLAPVVPMKLAIKVPTRIKVALTVGVALRSPVIEMPPEITYSENSSMMNGMYSPGIACSIARSAAVGPSTTI